MTFLLYPSWYYDRCCKVVMSRIRKMAEPTKWAFLIYFDQPHPHIALFFFFHVITLLQQVYAFSGSRSCTIITTKPRQLDESMPIWAKHLSTGTFDAPNDRPWLIVMLIRCNICSADQCISHNLCDLEGVYIWYGGIATKSKEEHRLMPHVRETACQCERSDSTFGCYHDAHGTFDWSLCFYIGTKNSSLLSCISGDLLVFFA